MRKNTKKVDVKNKRRGIWMCIAMAMLVMTIGVARGQESSFVAKQQKMALLPGNVSNVSIVDGELYCYSSGVLLIGQRSGEQLLGFWADTAMTKLSDNVEYVVKHPTTGEVYFTQRNKKGLSTLYVCREMRDGNYKAVKVKMGGMSVEHPTFSTDGRIMIFSSRDKHKSYGGADLWYCQLENGKWSKPVNMGGRVNTGYDEVTPTIYKEYLLFSSNGYGKEHGYLNIYATRLINSRVTGDTIGMLQIGRSVVQKLPEPINSADADEFDIAIDTANEYGYWISKREESDSDSQLYSFNGVLDGVMLYGRVSDKFGNTIEGATVYAMQGGKTVCTTTTDEEGAYRLYLQADQYYEIVYRKGGYFVSFNEINTAKKTEDMLIAEMQNDATLDRLQLGQRITYTDLFGRGVDINLSQRGKDEVEALVRFLVDNPTMKVNLTVYSDATTDKSFNAILTEHRKEKLQDYLFSIVPPSVEMTFVNGCAGKEGCSSASGISRLVVIITE